MNDYFLNKTASNFGDSKKYWKLYKQYVKTKNSNYNSSIDCLFDKDNNLQTDSSLIANTFNKFFTNIKSDVVISDFKFFNY